ncbi:stage III sporulation protein AA [Clostridium pascui]|nr:stage III sporulation protein AA [Clostridium pascui]MBM7869216.1 stage III sporulation protein AA [Clostridium pascui]
MINTKEIFRILPDSIKSLIGEENFNKVQEIRLRVNKPLMLEMEQKEKVFNYIVSSEEIDIVLKRMSNYSIYAYDEEIKRGYITVKGGHRIGICGKCIVEKEKIKTIKDISSLNIRISKEILGCSDNIVKYLVDKDEIVNTIIISPPKCGKTTLLRDIARNISDGMVKFSLLGKKITVIDERSELSACYNGAPQLNLGIRTDVLDSCPKSEGIITAIRSMAPEVIICDEIGTVRDTESIVAAMNSGVKVITSIHGYDISDLYNRPVFKEIIDNKVFKRAVVMSHKKGPGTIEYIYDFLEQKKIFKEVL